MNVFIFFFQAEDGIRDKLVTGVQTCALPIWPDRRAGALRSARPGAAAVQRAPDPRRGGVMTDWTRKTAAELADALAAGEVTSVELTQAHLDRIAAVDGAVHAFLHV